MNGPCSCASAGVMALFLLVGFGMTSIPVRFVVALRLFLVDSFEEPPVLRVAFSRELVVRNEAQGGRIDAIAQTTSLGRPIVEDMTEMTLTMGRTDLDASDPEAGVEL